VGGAWIASGMHANGTLLTVEKDPDRAAGPKSLFRGHPSIEVLAGDWSPGIKNDVRRQIWLETTPTTPSRCGSHTTPR
jgi:predicted O-methyltransferase YrrM